MNEQFDNKQDLVKDSSAEGNEDGTEKDKACKHCGADCCVAVEMQPMLLSLLEIYGTYKLEEVP